MSSIKILEFKLLSQIYGIDLKFIKEVGNIDNFFKIPFKVNYFEGLFNLRGNILPVINIGKKLGLDYNISSNFKKKYILVTDTQYFFLIIVDKILGVKKVSEASKDFGSESIIEEVFIDEDDIISLIDVKKIININDFKYTKKFIFKSIQAIEDLSLEKQQEDLTKIAFTMFKLKENYYAINSNYIKQLMIYDRKNLNFVSDKGIVIGKFDYDNKIIEIINLIKILNSQTKDKNFFIAVIENKNNIAAFLIPEETEFIVISEDSILDEISIIDKYPFINKSFKYKNNFVRIIDINKLFDFIKLKGNN